MEKMFCLGLMLGMVGGAVIVANSYKMRSFVKKSQSDLMDKVNEVIDEKMQGAQNGAQPAETEKKRR